MMRRSGTIYWRNAVPRHIIRLCCMSEKTLTSLIRLDFPIPKPKRLYIYNPSPPDYLYPKKGYGLMVLYIALDTAGLDYDISLLFSFFFLFLFLSFFPSGLTASDCGYYVYV